MRTLNLSEKHFGYEATGEASPRLKMAWFFHTVTGE
jgi:hypothetical protein